MFAKKPRLAARGRLRVTESLDDNEALLLHDIADTSTFHSLNSVSTDLAIRSPLPGESWTVSVLFVLHRLTRAQIPSQYELPLCSLRSVF